MNQRVLMMGNEAIAEAAIRAGCTAYFGYPITPQNELIAYIAEHLPGPGRVFIQAESEVAAINMVYGAAAAGARAMTSSSSPGISLKQEGLSYAAGADIPLVYVNIVRGGPGLGSIAPAQSDYFQSTRGGGHGDYHVIVLAPDGVQEAADLTVLAFDLADTWRMPVLILADGVIGQMMEAITLPPVRSPESLPDKTAWTVGGMNKTRTSDGSVRKARHITSIYLIPEELENIVKERFKRYERIKKEEVRFETTSCDDADLVLVAYGTAARVSLGAVEMAQKQGKKIGLFRPITLWPFPTEELEKIAKRGIPLLTVEMSMGQLVEDVRLVARDSAPVYLLPHTGGVIPTEEEVYAKALEILEETK
ncbi:MAG TPA: 3-methyl-2-oxobutanoate dehydrogenase subunit VorB [Treponema sp.]|nr:3-methyl-2-oxobutanoate dehydrogenase subunit VorB [Treponema sp.]